MLKTYKNQADEGLETSGINSGQNLWDYIDQLDKESDAQELLGN